MIKKRIDDEIIYYHKPPAYECIKNIDNETNNLFDKYLNMQFKEKNYVTWFKIDMITKLFNYKQ